jgi:hypothetical protein
MILTFNMSVADFPTAFDKLRNVSGVRVAALDTRS